MKCDNCGRNEANYYYSSNINGNVTEKHLCSECAAKLGRETDLFSDVDGMFEDMLGGFFGRRSALGGYSRWPGFGLAIPALLMPQVQIRLGDTESAAPAQKAAADPEMQRARELNVLRAKMKEAAENEDFEKAAELRDQIKKLEAAGEKGGAAE